MNTVPLPPAPPTALDHARHVIHTLFGPSTTRTFAVRYWNGTTEVGGQVAPPFTLVICRPGTLRRMLLPPSELSIVEAYLSGDIDVEGIFEDAVTLADAINARVKSPRTLAAITHHLLALPHHDTDLEDTADVRAARASPTVKPTGREHEPARDQAAIRYHYDVGNDFYALWLDTRMVYSCAYFASETTTLDDAQVAKLDLVCRKLRLGPDDQLLDVGCGWGGLIIHAVQQYGVTALGLTLSEAQATFARERIAALGLADRCHVEIRDYRELPDYEKLNKFTSVGMVEHVGEQNLPVYFTRLYSALTAGGLLLNHGIVSLGAARPYGWRERIERKLWRRDAFINEYVFPDGRLTPLAAVIAAAEGAGFETRDVESLREHYAMTLRQWVARLTAHADRAIALTNERTYRTWRLYMTAAAHGFATGRLNVVQTLLAKPDVHGRVPLPLRREHDTPPRPPRAP
jgi:cyclopropane-fatty-acyl-phospholipid synthase